ncbi:MAG: PD-(D/E)XK nuclease family protein [Methanophagales archaeon ANME-1-THS]|nr:MAG: PD-(D/E)XK nuclease family protein [Methanophagales archaeon ANME-1-THS]
MTQGILPPLPPLEPLKRISPSQFPIFRKCKLRAIWSSCHAQALLPLPPSARLGIIIHKILEKAGKGDITGEDSFNSLWLSCVQEEENDMSGSWMEKHLVPLEKSAHNFEVKKQQCILLVRNLMSAFSHQSGKADSSKRASHEVWLQTPDGKVGGYVDAIISTDAGDVIIDFKTGSIAESEEQASFDPEVRYDYRIQAKLYAALYNSMYGKWPASIELVGLDGVPRTIPFYQEECPCLLDEARQLLNDINFVITNKAKNYESALSNLASPNPGVCQFCLYRPCCPSYWEKRGTEPERDWPHDAKGKLKEIKKLRNGFMLIKLISDPQNSNIITVRGLHPDRHPALNKTLDEVLVFSMIPGKVTNNYGEGKLTTIYAGAD